MWPFFNPTIEVVTFRLCGWCMLGVFMLPAFSRLGHKCRNLLSPCNGIHVHKDWTSIYTLIRKSFGGMASEPMLTPSGKIPSTKKKKKKKNLLRGESNVQRCIKQVASPTHYQRAIPALILNRSALKLASFFDILMCSSSHHVSSA